MTSAAISEVKVRLSELLGRVKAGEEVVITDRGKPVARLCPFSRAIEPPDSRLARLEKLGQVSVGRGTLPPGFWTAARPDDPAGLVLDALLEERAGER